MGGVSPDLEKAEDFAGLKTNAGIKQVQVFLGAIYFFTKGISRFAETATPLTELSR